MFYSLYIKANTVLFHALENMLIYYPHKIQRPFVPKFSHNRNKTSFLKELNFVGVYDKIDRVGLSEFPDVFGRKLYEYRKKTVDPNTITTSPADNGWPMPRTYVKSFGPTVSGFKFEFLNTSRRLKVALEPATNLLNLEKPEYKDSHFLDKNDFYSHQKEITELIAEYNKLPGKYFVNESYFLYEKSNLIKNTYITTLNKTIYVYGSFSYFQTKTSNESLHLLDAGNFLNFLVEQNSLRNELKFQLTNISENIPKTKDNEAHQFSITRLGRKRKLAIQEPVETIIVCVQQNFEIVGGLNPIQIEPENNRILNTLKIYKNVLCRVMPLGILFPATVKNDTKQIFATSRELNDVKKAILNDNVYGILAIIDLNKIDNWGEVKGQSVWINAAFKDQNEINNNSHLCFPFVTQSLNDLVSFSIYLIDDDNEELTFTSRRKNN